MELEDAVARLQKDLAEYRKELGYGGARGAGEFLPDHETVGIYINAGSQVFGEV